MVEHPQFKHMAERVLAVRDRIALINTDTDRPSAQKDWPDLLWACQELREIADQVRAYRSGPGMIDRRAVLDAAHHVLTDGMHKRALANAGALPEGDRAPTTYEIETQIVDAVLTVAEAALKQAHDDAFNEGMKEAGQPRGRTSRKDRDKHRRLQADVRALLREWNGTEFPATLGVDKAVKRLEKEV